MFVNCQIEVNISRGRSGLFQLHHIGLSRLREVRKIVQTWWKTWKRMVGIICGRRVTARVKGKGYKMAVRPAMLYGLETVALTKRQEAEMGVTELKTLRFSLGVTRMDNIRNEYIRRTEQVGRFGEKTRKARLYGGKMMGGPVLEDGCRGWNR